MTLQDKPNPKSCPLLPTAPVGACAKPFPAAGQRGNEPISVPPLCKPESCCLKPASGGAAPVSGLSALEVLTQVPKAGANPFASGMPEAAYPSLKRERLFLSPCRSSRDRQVSAHPKTHLGLVFDTGQTELPGRVQGEEQQPDNGHRRQAREGPCRCGR